MARSASKKKSVGLDGRHRDKDGEIHKKSGRTLIKSLRKTYGEHFAAGYRGDMMLATLLARSQCETLHEYLKKHHK
jgi:hypothetical protein